jgi:hypothetical protein
METAQPPVVSEASAGSSPLGVTAAPFIRSGTAAVVDLARRADRLGYDSFWVAEVTGIEAFSVLGAASRAAPGVGLGTGVLAMQVRTPPGSTRPSGDAEFGRRHPPPSRSARLAGFGR